MASPSRQWCGFDGWEWAVLLVLLAIVWGNGAFSRGPFQDDTVHLHQMEIRRVNPPLNSFGALGASRPLAVLPAFLAVRTPSPVRALQSMHGLLWLAQALLAASVARRLFAGNRTAAWAAACVTLCATSDYLTNSMVAIAYNQAIVAVLAGFVLGLDFVLGKHWWRVPASAACFAISIWTVDVALPVIVALPLWVLAFRPRAQRMRTAAWVGAILLAALPFGVDLLRRMQGDAYIKQAVQAVSADVWADRVWVLFKGNFTPWRWAFDRAVWAIPELPLWSDARLAWVGALAAAVGLIPLLRGGGRDLRLLAPQAAGDPRISQAWTAAALLLTALAGHVVYARVHFQHIWYRTHVSSRIWCSLLVVLVALAIARRLRRVGIVALLLPWTFVWFGAAGGVERQSYYSAIWRRHQQELSSFVRQAPGLAPGTRVLLLANPPKGRYLATEVPYLASSWGQLLYGHGVHFVLVSAESGLFCRANPPSIECPQSPCFDPKGCAPNQYDPATTVIFNYDNARNEWLLAERLPMDLAAVDPEGSRYQPRRLISGSAPTHRQRALLLID